MLMSNSEIVSRYRNGIYKPKQMVQVIADLNGCKKKDIVRILFEEGELNGQSIYRYRKSGELICTDEEAKKYTKHESKKAAKAENRITPASVPASGNKTEATVEPKVPENPRTAEEAPKVPKLIIDYAEEYLRSNEEAYRGMIEFVKEYEALKAWVEAHG